jgi:hypothetical protein
MSLTVTQDLKQRASAGTMTQDEFIDCIKHSLPQAWQIVDQLVRELRSDDRVSHAVHAPKHMSEEQRGQLLRLVASSAMRAAVERATGLKLEFQNCHKLAAFRLEAVGLADHSEFVSAPAQILAQSPELVDC